MYERKRKINDFKIGQMNKLQITYAIHGPHNRGFNQYIVLYRIASHRIVSYRIGHRHTIFLSIYIESITKKMSAHENESVTQQHTVRDSVQ